MTITQYQMVREFNIAFGVKVNPEFYPRLIVEQSVLANLRYNLIEEEVLELQEALKNNDRKETIDALADILYVGWGAGVSFGIDMDKQYHNYLNYMGNPMTYPDFESKSNYENTLISIPNSSITKENGLDKLFIALQHVKQALNVRTETEKEENTDHRKQLGKYLCRLIYHVYRLVEVHEVDINRAFKIVHDSNMSKLCKTEEIARTTVQWYKDNNTVYDSPAYRKSDLGEYYVVFNESTGKILKSVDYTPADFSCMLE